MHCQCLNLKWVQVTPFYVKNDTVNQWKGLQKGIIFVTFSTKRGLRVHFDVFWLHNHYVCFINCVYQSSVWTGDTNRYHFKELPTKYWIEFGLNVLMIWISLYKSFGLFSQKWNSVGGNAWYEILGINIDKVSDKALP